MSDQPTNESRRRFVKASALTSGALALGLPGSVTAQQTDTPTGDGQNGDFRPGVMFSDEYREGAVFRVTSPDLQSMPISADGSNLQNWSVRVVEYFNTNEESYLLLPPDADVTEGDLYVLGDQFTPFDGAFDDENLIEVDYRPLDQGDFPFDLEEEDLDIVEEGGGEGALRPNDFYSGALFRVTSGTQGWVPEDVAGSGLFTDYNTVHAEYLGSGERFLFFPQEDAQVQQGRLYVMWDEFEFVDPAGNLVAVNFDLVNEEGLTVDDEYL